MAFPTSPTNGQQATVNGILYTYASATRSWTRILASANLITANSITLASSVSASTITASSIALTTSVSSNVITANTITVASSVSSNVVTANSITLTTSVSASTITASSIALTTTVSANAITANSIALANSASINSKNVITNFTGNSAPTSPRQGDEWYYRPTDTLYKYIYDGATYNWISISSALYAANTGAVANTIALRDSGGNLTATNFLGVASSAKYADLAEKYISDQTYAPGIVVIFGGEQEITITDQTHDTRVAGVISTNPAYLMNSECPGLPVAFTGRVPCFVKGPVNKGDLLVTSNEPGVAQALDEKEYKPGCVFGKSLGQIIDTTITTIEVVVGRY